MKWAIAAVIAVVVLGVGGYAIYRWTDVPERAEAWMDAQDLKNFPTQAKREVKDMRDNLAKYKSTKKDLEKDIIKREGVSTWSATDLEGTVLGYDAEIKKFDSAIKDIVAQVQAERDKLKADGVVHADSGTVPADHKYTITSAGGKELKWTEADARKQTDTMFEQMQKAQRKRERQVRIVTAKKEYVGKLDDAVSRLDKKIEEMEEFIEDMETELELLKIEEDIASINASLAGDNDDNRFGKTIRMFRDKKKEFLAEQELADREAPKDDSYFDAPEDKTSGSSASYWN